MKKSPEPRNSQSHVSAAGFALFDTSLGKCAIGWTDVGVAGVQLPEVDAAQTRRRSQRRFGAPDEASAPADVQQAIAAIVKLLDGERADLSSVALDMTGLAPFDRSVYETTRRIPSSLKLAPYRVSIPTVSDRTSSFRARSQN